MLSVLYVNLYLPYYTSISVFCNDTDVQWQQYWYSFKCGCNNICAISMHINTLRLAKLFLCSLIHVALLLVNNIR